MQNITDSYLRRIGKVAYKLILDWYQVTRFTPANFQLPV